MSGQNMPEVSCKDLSARLKQGEAITLIDVREPFEREICHIGGKLIPLKEVESRLSEIPREGVVIVYCKSGGRSGQVVKALQHKHGYNNLYNLSGGVTAWADQIDPSLEKY